MYTLRARFKKDIVAEFLPPARKSSRVIIICGGMPCVPSKKELLSFWAKKGFWVFYPRFRGTWESGGEFLKKSPHEDILDIINELPKGFIDLWGKAHYQVKPSKLYLIGSSFGGPAALLASRDKRVTKTVVVSSITDTPAMKHSKAEPLGWLYTIVQGAFGEAYRCPKKNWNKLSKGFFYNPTKHIHELDGSKIIFIHAQDDQSVACKPVQQFAKKINAAIILLKKGGHLSASITAQPRFYKAIQKFFRA